MKTSSSFWKIAFWIILIILIIFGIIVSFLFLSGRLAYNIDGVYGTVCTEPIISSFNTEIQGKDGSHTPDISALNTLEATIKSRDNYSQDPTCQTILFTIALQNNNTASAKVAYDQIILLHSQHKYSDPTLQGVGSLTDMKNLLTSYQQSLNTAG